MTLRFLHISDLHFYKFSWNPLQIFSKRIIGNFNHRFTRAEKFSSSLPFDLLDEVKNFEATHLVISGDFTCTALKREFEVMKQFLSQAETKGIKVISLPGNHDMYTVSAYLQKRFYKEMGLQFFEKEFPSPWNLQEHKVSAIPLIHPWWMVLVDNATAASPWHSTGHFLEKTEKHLRDLLLFLPTNASIVMLSHFPLEHEDPFKRLKRSESLTQIIEDDRRVRLFLHGHNHKAHLEMRSSYMIADAGSISLQSNSSFNLIELNESGCEVTQFKRHKNQWEMQDVREKIDCLV